MQYLAETRVIDRHEEATRAQVLVAEEVFGRVQDADRQAAPLTFQIRGLGVLHEEEALDDVLDVAEVGLPVRDVEVRGLCEVSGHVLAVQPLDENLPGLLIAENEREVHEPVEALEQRRLCGLGLGVSARLPLDDGPWIEPIRVRQLAGHTARIVHRDVHQVTASTALAFDEGEEQADVREARRGVERLISTRPDGRD